MRYGGGTIRMPLQHWRMSLSMFVVVNNWQPPTGTNVLFFHSKFTFASTVSALWLLGLAQHRRRRYSCRSRRCSLLILGLCRHYLRYSWYPICMLYLWWFCGISPSHDGRKASYSGRATSTFVVVIVIAQGRCCYWCWCWCCCCYTRSFKFEMLTTKINLMMWFRWCFLQ